MKLLLDTSAFLWWLTEDRRLGSQARSAVAGSENVVFVSAASAWEIAIKRSLGKLEVEGDVLGWIEGAEFTELPVRVIHAYEAETLPLHHRDPFDRMLIAQSRHEGMTLVTSDAKIAQYDVEILAADR